MPQPGRAEVSRYADTGHTANAPEDGPRTSEGAFVVYQTRGGYHGVYDLLVMNASRRQSHRALSRLGSLVILMVFLIAAVLLIKSDGVENMSALVPASSPLHHRAVKAVDSLHALRGVNDVPSGPAGSGLAMQEAQGKAALDELKELNLVPGKRSTSLWDFPEIKRYQVQTSRANFWDNMKKLEDKHAYSLEWPNVASADFKWPSPEDGDESSTSEHLVKAGGLLRRGDIMPVTRPYIQWSSSCSISFCPLDTPQKERAYAWRYCMNHFYTNAEKRYCFQAVLSPPKPKPSCEPFADPEHGRVLIPPGSRDSYNVHRVRAGYGVVIVCDEGYEVKGDAKPKCKEDGSFTEQGICVPVSCGKYPAPLHGTVSPTTAIQYPDVVKVACDDGYYLEGDEVIRCSKDGKFDGSARCSPVVCPPFPPVEHGKVVPSGETEAGDKVSIVCDEGYEVQDVNSKDVVCGKDGHYLSTGTTCVPIVCPPYSFPAHSSGKPAGEKRVGETVEGECDNGYEAFAVPEESKGATGSSSADRSLGKEFTVECGQDKNYHPAVVCSAYCDPFVNVVHGKATPQRRMRKDEKVTIKCDDGYQLPDGVDGEVVCEAGNQYNPSSVTCQKIPSCPPYPVPDHGHVSPEGSRSKVGDQVDIVCDPGYKLGPGYSGKAICEPDGQYDQPEAECVKIEECPPYPTPAHGRASPQKIMHVGDQVNIECDDGYRLSPESSSVATCIGSTYNYPSAVCQPLPICGVFAPPEHGSVKPAGNVSEGGCVKIQCDDGYVFEADEEGSDHPCCEKDIISGSLDFQPGGQCVQPDQACSICSDITVCPHCFIGRKEFPAKRRSFHFD